MKNLLLGSTIMLLTSTGAFAESSKATVEDHYKTVIEQTPYKVEVCKDVQVPVNSKKEMDTDGAILGGIIGGVIGNQFGKGDGKTAMTGIGAMTGAIIGGTKEGKPDYRWERRCTIETRYQEEKKEVYSHSTVKFYYEGKLVKLNFSK